MASLFMCPRTMSIINIRMQVVTTLEGIDTKVLLLFGAVTAVFTLEASSAISPLIRLRMLQDETPSEETK